MDQNLKILSECFTTFETEQQYVNTYKKDLVDTYYQQYSAKDAPVIMAGDILRLEYQRQKLLKSEKYWRKWWGRTYAVLVLGFIGFVIFVALS